MTYQQKFDLFRNSLLSYCKDCIAENWERLFSMWLRYDADIEFGHGYQTKFKEQFGHSITSKIEDQLWFAGKNSIFAILAFLSYKDSADLDDVLYFTEKFISEQLDDFDTWCHDIREAMCEETLEYEKDDTKKEDIPPESMTSKCNVV